MKSCESYYTAADRKQDFFIYADLKYVDSMKIFENELTLLYILRQIWQMLPRCDKKAFYEEHHHCRRCIIIDFQNIIN